LANKIASLGLIAILASLGAVVALRTWETGTLDVLDALAGKVSITADWEGRHFTYMNRKLYNYQIVDSPNVEQAALYVAYWPEGNDPECFFSLYTWHGEYGIEVEKAAMSKLDVYYNGQLLVEFPESVNGQPQVGYFNLVGPPIGT
jgi:hypothetical protein